MSRSWFRRRKYATGGPVSAGSIVVLGGCDLTVPQPVDEDLVDRVAKLTVEVRELHEAVDRLTAGRWHLMCRSNIDPAARDQLARVMTDIAQVLADEAGVQLADVHIGPVDFGDVDELVAP